MRHVILNVALIAVTGSVLAQAPQRGGRGGAPQVVEKIRELKPGLFMITGAGANTLVRVTKEGLIVVDTKNPGDATFARIMEEIRSVTDQPVRYVINSHHHPDHTGNNGKFIESGAQVIGLEALKTRMQSDPRTKDIPGPPGITFPRDHVIRLGGVEVRAYHFGRGHTDDDTMVYFPDHKIVMVSDQITDATPIVDWANGGSALEWRQTLDGVLKLDFESAIPGRGEPKSRADVQAFRNKIDALLTRAAEAKAKGAEVKTDDLGWQFNAQFFTQLFNEL
jgi:cyclase